MSFFDKKDKKDNEDNKDNKEGKVLTETNEDNKSNENAQGNEDASLEVDPTREVLVKSKTLFTEKIVVIYKKIKPQSGPSRDQFNIYTFDEEGECKMLERDAILFWKNRMGMANVENDDVSMFILNSEGFEEFEYSFDDVKNLYKIEEEGLTSSEPRNL